MSGLSSDAGESRADLNTAETSVKMSNRFITFLRNLWYGKEYFRVITGNGKISYALNLNNEFTRGRMRGMVIEVAIDGEYSEQMADVKIVISGIK